MNLATVLQVVGVLVVIGAGFAVSVALGAALVGVALVVVGVGVES
jgi:hypothetical protein